MKKLLLLMIALVCVPVLKANPVVPPPATIELSEIAFESNGNWVIELQYFNYYHSNEDLPIDSVFISSSTGRAKLKRFKIGTDTGIIMVRNDSLLSNLVINPTSDSIHVTYFRRSYSNDPTTQTTAAVYGDLVTATLHSPKTGQSIAGYGAPGLYNHFNYSRNVEYIYSNNKSHSIGLVNDTTGMLGTVQGKIYDANNQLIKASDITFYGLGLYDFQAKSDGTYSTRIFSKNHHINQLMYNSGTNRFYLDIAPINVCILPDTVVTADIHILKVTAVEQLKSDPQQVMRVFPNPLTELSFKYAISIPVKSSDSYLELINMAGQQVARYRITEDKGKIDLSANTTNGIYTLRLIVNNKNYGTNKITIAH